MRRLLIRLNNWITSRRRVHVAARRLLLLLPRCLQNSDCEHNIAADIDRCQSCGQCDIAALRKLRDRYGILCSLVTGGQQAVQDVKNPDVKAVVAVACEKELLDGIRICFPKPVLAVPNTRPAGPCHDTRVDLDKVEAAIRSLLETAHLSTIGHSFSE